MEHIKYFSIILTVILVLVIIILNKAIKNGQFTCNNFIVNTYLYLALALMIVSLCVGYFEDNTNLLKFKERNILSVIITFVSLFAMFYLQKNIYLSHLLWIIFLISISYTLLPLYELLNRDKTLVKSLISTVIIVLIMTFIAYKYPKYINLNIYSTLIMSLVIGIILSIVNYFYKTKYRSKFRIILSYFFIFLFSLFILHDTKFLRIKATMCHAKGLLPNYPRDSLNLFLDILNIFTNYGYIAK